MKTLKMITAAAAVSAIALASAFAQSNPTVGGAEMMADKPIAENASNAPNLTTLVTAAKQAGLVETLAGEGPYTVFAPTDDAFAKVPQETMDAVMKDENKEMLKGVLMYHVVPGKMTAADLMKAIQDGGGSANLTTAAGGTITAKMDGDNVVIVDEAGGGAIVETADVMQSNGVVHVIGSVLMPKM